MSGMPAHAARRRDPAVEPVHPCGRQDDDDSRDRLYAFVDALGTEKPVGGKLAGRPLGPSGGRSPRRGIRRRHGAAARLSVQGRLVDLSPQRAAATIGRPGCIRRHRGRLDALRKRRLPDPWQPTGRRHHSSLLRVSCLAGCGQGCNWRSDGNACRQTERRPGCVRAALGKTARKGQAKYWPPLAEIVEPVMKPASSEARKATHRAISSGSPRRPTGICGMMRSLSTFSSMALTMSVAI